MKVVISSGHGLKIRGAAGPAPWGLDEVNEARKVVEQVAKVLRGMGVEVTTFHDDVSTSQNENLNRIVSFHNSKTRDTDISVHFNAYDQTAHGTEVLYVTQKALAQKVAQAISTATGLTLRGDKGAVYRDGLAFLNNTDMPSILVETLFCDNKGDCDTYRAKFSAICTAIADGIAGEAPGVPMPPPKPEVAFHVIGKCSYFGGPGDTTGMTSSEGLAFLYKQSDKPEVFMAGKSLDSPALGWDLNPFTHYLACRWDYDVTPKTMLVGKQVALVRAIDTGIALTAMPSDWGPNSATGRVADLSPSLMADLQIATDDEVEILYPYAPPKVA